MEQISVTINATERKIPRGSVAELVAAEVGKPEGVAVAVDGQVVPRSQWDRMLDEGAAIDILTAVQGG